MIFLSSSMILPTSWMILFVWGMILPTSDIILLESGMILIALDVILLVSGMASLHPWETDYPWLNQSHILKSSNASRTYMLNSVLSSRRNITDQSNKKSFSMVGKTQKKTFGNNSFSWCREGSRPWTKCWLTGVIVCCFQEKRKTTLGMQAGSVIIASCFTSTSIFW